MKFLIWNKMIYFKFKEIKIYLSYYYKYEILNPSTLEFDIFQNLMLI